MTTAKAAIRGGVRGRSPGPAVALDRPVLVVDNYDSFTWNLVQYFGELGVDPVVIRNDAITVAGIRAKDPAALVISPGPGDPDDAGVSLAAIRAFAGKIPILGVCLGHQSIGQVFGARVVRAPAPCHGKTSSIRHDGTGLFRGISDPFTATRYHSLVVDRATVKPPLRVTATTEDGLVMGLAHAAHPVFGVQFHPESILTLPGHDLLRNFLEIARDFRRTR